MDKCPPEEFVDCKSHINPSDAQDKCSKDSTPNSDNYFDVREEFLFTETKDSNSQDFKLDIYDSEATSQLSENTPKLTTKNFNSFSSFSLKIQRLSLDNYAKIKTIPKKTKRKPRQPKKVSKHKVVQQRAVTKNEKPTEVKVQKHFLESIPNLVEQEMVEDTLEKLEITEMPEIIEIEVPFIHEKVESPKFECINPPVKTENVISASDENVPNSPQELFSTLKEQLGSPPISQYAEEDIINIRVSPSLFPDSPSHKKEEVVLSPKYCIPKTKDSRKKDDFHRSPIHFERKNSKSQNEASRMRDSKRSPSRKSPSRRRSLSPRASPRRSSRSRRSTSKRSPRRSPRYSPSRRSPRRRRSPAYSSSNRSPRNSASRSSPRRRSPKNSPSRSSPRRRSPRNSPSRSSPRRRSPRSSQSKSSPRRSPPKRKRSPSRSPYRRGSPRRNSPRRSPMRRVSPRRSPSRRTPPRRSPIRRSPLRRSPIRRSPRRSPLRRGSPRQSPSRNSPIDRRLSPWSHRRSPVRRSPLRRSPYDRPSLGGSTGINARFSPPRPHVPTSVPLGRYMPPLRDRSRSPTWDPMPGRDRPFDAFRDDPLHSKPPSNISINLASRLDRNAKNSEKKIAESPISMSISPPTSTHEDDGDTMRIVSRSSIRNRIGHNTLSSTRLHRSGSSSPIRRPFNIRDEFFDRDSISPHYQDESREYLPPLPPNPYIDKSRAPKLPIVSFNYNPAIDAPLKTSPKNAYKSHPTESSYNILDQMFQDLDCQKQGISLYLPTEHYIPKDLPPPLPCDSDKDPTLVPFPERHVICPLCKSVLYAKRYEFHLRGKCMFRSQLNLDPPENPDNSPELSFAKQFSQGNLVTQSVDKIALGSISPIEKRPFYCPEKQCEFQGVIESIREHYAKAHFYINCFHCKQSLVDPNTFPTHLSYCLNKSPVICHICACHYPLVNSYSLGHHILNQHNTETCVICLQKMSWKTYQAHVIRCMFNNQHRYRCPICNGSNRIDSLATHMLTKHYRDVCPICKHMTGKKSIIHVSKCFLDATGMNLTFIRPDNKVKCTLCTFQTSFYEIASHYLKLHATTKCIFCELVFDVKEYANHIGLCCQKYDGIPVTSLHPKRPPISNVSLHSPTYEMPSYPPVAQQFIPSLESGPSYRFSSPRPYPNPGLGLPNQSIVPPPNYPPNQQMPFRKHSRFDSS